MTFENHNQKLIVFHCLQAIPTSPPIIIEQPSEEENVIKIQVQGTRPIVYRWFRDGKELSDGNDYKGSTTSELVIIGTGQQVKGQYKCEVKNNYGEIITQEIGYGEFRMSVVNAIHLLSTAFRFLC